MATASVPSRLVRTTDLTNDVRARALDARDARFDGLFFVGITTTRIYCRPVCPARVSHRDRRRFFESAAAAERAGFRPCLRCRPELAPGRAIVDAVPRLAHAAAHRIAAGGLNGRNVAELARELGVSARHLRRAMEHELGVSPVELAQTHRLLLAKQLLADTALPVTRIAYASGFQSLRRFNAAFSAQYRMPPSALRRPVPRGSVNSASPESGLLTLTLGYREPFAWDALLAVLQRDAIAGVEVVGAGRYARTLRLEKQTGFIVAEDAAGDTARASASRASAHVRVHMSPSLVPVLMPLLGRLRRLFDLDAEPSVIDAHLAQAGLGTFVSERPGLRVPGAFDGFEVAFRTLLRGSARAGSPRDGVARAVRALGEPLDTGVPGLDRLAPTAERITEAGVSELTALGVAAGRARALVTVASLISNRTLRLEAGANATAARRTLLAIDGVGERLATAIVVRALSWPDAFSPSDRTLQRAAGAASAAELLACAERWRPWRAYAALHLATARR